VISKATNTVGVNFVIVVERFETTGMTTPSVRDCL
jgi:hypothetical protein